MTNMSAGTGDSKQLNPSSQPTSQETKASQETFDCVYGKINGGNCSGNCNACFEYNGFELEVPVKINPITLFRDELGQILDERVLFIVRHILRVVPPYFYVMPASTSGKYHPKYALGIQGLVRHVKAAVRIFLEMCHNDAFGQYSDYELDIGVAALILHDSVKCGYDGSQHTVHEHPILVAALCSSWGSEEYDKIWNDINDLIKTHTGQWITDYKNPEAPRLEEPKTPLQKFVHMCDYIASRKTIPVDLDSPLDYRKPQKESAPKKASEAQLRYLLDLTSKLKKKGIEVPDDINKYDFADPKYDKVSEFIGICLELLK